MYFQLETIKQKILMLIKKNISFLAFLPQNDYISLTIQASHGKLTLDSEVTRIMLRVFLWS